MYISKDSIISESSYCPDDLMDSSLDPMWTEVDFIATPTASAEGADGYQTDIASGSQNGKKVYRTAVGASRILTTRVELATTVNDYGGYLIYGTDITHAYVVQIFREANDWKVRAFYDNNGSLTFFSTTNGLSNGNIWLSMAISNTHIQFFSNIAGDSAEPPTTGWVSLGTELLRFLPLTGSMIEGFFAVNWGTNPECSLKVKRFRSYIS